MKTDSLAIIQKLTEEHTILNDSIKELHNQNLLENLDLIRNMTTFYDSAWMKLASVIALIGIFIPLYFSYLTKKRNDELRIKLEEDIKRNEAYSIKRNQESEARFETIFNELEKSIIVQKKKSIKVIDRSKTKLEKDIKKLDSKLTKDLVSLNKWGQLNRHYNTVLRQFDSGNYSACLTNFIISFTYLDEPKHLLDLLVILRSFNDLLKLEGITKEIIAESLSEMNTIYGTEDFQSVIEALRELHSSNWAINELTNEILITLNKKMI